MISSSAIRQFLPWVEIVYYSQKPASRGTILSPHDHSKKMSKKCKKCYLTLQIPCEILI